MKRVKPRGVLIVSDKAFTYSNINTFFWIYCDSKTQNVTLYATTGIVKIE